MKQKTFEFKHKGGEHGEIYYLYHVDGVVGNDSTLCGCGYDSSIRTFDMQPTGKEGGAINCPDCIKIIKYCKKINL